MAVPQIGDLIKFGELGWKVWDYGWSEDKQANRQYKEFGDDVRHLSNSLDRLSAIINDAKAEFRDHRQSPPRTKVWDEGSLLDIIGDYKTTLNDCFALLRDKQCYETTTGAARFKNVQWNALVQPDIERLRSRIVLHNTKIQLVLAPFENDLRMRIYRDLRTRIQDVHTELRQTRAELQSLISRFDPGLAQNLGLQQHGAISEVLIPDSIRQELEIAFRLHPDVHLLGPSYDVPIRDIADAYIRIFGMSTRKFEPGGRNREPPEHQYMALLTSQFLMFKMLDSYEVRASSPTSHWPSYIRTLQQELSRECQRFEEQMVAPTLADGLPSPTIWPREEVPDQVVVTSIPVMMDYLFDLPLVTNTDSRWRTLRLLRYCDGADRRFRMLIAEGDSSSLATETMPIEIDIATAQLVPRYAFHDGKEGLKMLLIQPDKMTRLDFRTRQELYLYQQALTGYKVVDDYMQYSSQVTFVTPSNRIVAEQTSFQLWRPMRLEGERMIIDSEQGRLPISGIISPDRTPSTHSNGTLRPARSPEPRSVSQQHSRAPSRQSQAGAAARAQWGSTSSVPSSSRSSNTTLPSSPTTNSSSSSRSSIFSSSASTTSSHASTSTTRAVSVTGGSANLSGTGMLHRDPTEPLLVFFTHNDKAADKARADSIVALPLGQFPSPNFWTCACATSPFCPDVALERSSDDDHNNGSSQQLSVTRLLGSNDLFPLVTSPPSSSSPPPPQSQNPHNTNNNTRRPLIRVTVHLPSAHARLEFSGKPCDCRDTDTEGGLMACIRQWHRGRLGAVKEQYRREMRDWSVARYRNKRNVIVDDQGRQHLGMMMR